jgi:hypothetical protein
MDLRRCDLGVKRCRGDCLLDSGAARLADQSFNHIKIGMKDHESSLAAPASKIVAQVLTCCVADFFVGHVCLQDELSRMGNLPFGGQGSLPYSVRSLIASLPTLNC